MEKENNMDLPELIIEETVEPEVRTFLCHYYGGNHVIDAEVEAEDEAQARVLFFDRTKFMPDTVKMKGVRIL